MKSIEAWDIVVNELKFIFLDRGYQYKKIKWHGFVKQLDTGFDNFILVFYNYYPLHIPSYSIHKRFNAVEIIHDRLIEKFNLNQLIKDTNETFWFSYESLNSKASSSYLPAVETKIGMLDNARQINIFMLETGFPMLEKYQNIEAIDAEINGENFWPTDWLYKFSLGGGFHFKRLIIAKLCNNPRFPILYAFHLAEHEEIKKKFPDQKPTLIDGKTSIEYLVEVLLKDC